MMLEMQVSPVFDKIKAVKTKGIVNEGGARSSKTYSVLQYFIELAYENYIRNNPGLIFSIARKTLVALKTTAMRDFFDIINGLGIYDKRYHNKTDNTYLLFNNLFEFIGMDNPQKKRGAKRHHLFLNEANEFELEDARQLLMRTSGKIIMDYNPSDIDHWIYDKILPREDFTLLHSTYKDNPFLEKSIVNEIESYRNTDEYYWKVYGLGERAMPENIIYSNWDIYKEEPYGLETIYALDFGFNNPATLLEIKLNETDAFIKQLFYERHLRNKDIITKMENLVDNKFSYHYGDSEDPKTIEDISDAGFNIFPAEKGPGSVLEGIKYLKTFNLHIHNNSTNVLKEIKAYKWKKDKKTDRPLDEPVKIMDHAMDAMRYGIYTFGREFLSKNTGGLGFDIKQERSIPKQSIRKEIEGILI